MFPLMMHSTQFFPHMNFIWAGHPGLRRKSTEETDTSRGKLKHYVGKLLEQFWERDF